VQAGGKLILFRMQVWETQRQECQAVGTCGFPNSWTAAENLVAGEYSFGLKSFHFNLQINVKFVSADAGRCQDSRIYDTSPLLLNMTGAGNSGRTGARLAGRVGWAKSSQPSPTKYYNSRTWGLTLGRSGRSPSQVGFWIRSHSTIRNCESRYSDITSVSGEYVSQSTSFTMEMFSLQEGDHWELHLGIKKKQCWKGLKSALGRLAGTYHFPRA
jgi:hypothetical protein